MSRAVVNLVHAEVLSPYVRMLTEGGAPLEKLFERCGIPVQAVYDHEALITMQQAHRLAGESSRYAGIENLGSQAGQRLRLTELGALGTAVQRAPSLFDAGRVVKAAVTASEPGSECWIEQGGGEAWFCYRPVHRFEAGGDQAEQFDLESLLKFVQLAAGEDWIPRKVRTTMVTEKGLRSASNFAEAEVVRSAEGTAIAFPSRLLARPLPALADKGGSRVLADDGSAPSALTWSEAVSSLLDSLFIYQSLPIMEVIADRLGIHPRTFQRNLAAEGTTYRRLAQRMLFRRATELLEDEKLLVKTISAELGYSSPNSFVRAFRQIAGVTPQAWRRLNWIYAG